MFYNIHEKRKHVIAHIRYKKENRHMSTPFSIALVPSVCTMEVFEFQDGDPTYQHTSSDGTIMPGGISIARLQQQFGGKEGEFTGPSGETYHISLTVWEGKDLEKTLLQMVFRVTPLFPADIDPELRRASFSQLSTPPSSSTTVADKGAASPSSPVIKSRPTSEGKRTGGFISCSDVHGDHRIKIRPSKTFDVGVTADVLLTLPEITVTDVHCPVCDAPIKFSEPLNKRLQEGMKWWGNEAKLQLIFEHPIDIAETRTVPENSPFVVHRYRRYTPSSVPARQKDPAIELSIVQKTHDHLITLTSDVGETTAHMLLALPEAKEMELTCPLCDEKLPVQEPFEQYIHILADDADGDTTLIAWSISHPREIIATKTPVPGSLIRAIQHTSSDDFIQKRYPGYPGFVVRKREG